MMTPHPDDYDPHPDDGEQLTLDVRPINSVCLVRSECLVRWRDGGEVLMTLFRPRVFSFAERMEATQ